MGTWGCGFLAGLVDGIWGWRERFSRHVGLWVGHGMLGNDLAIAEGVGCLGKARGYCWLSEAKINAGLCLKAA